MISALLLAAGQSKRMGTPKQLLPLGNETILTMSLGVLLKADIEEVVLVLGHRWDDILKAVKIKDPRVRVALNRDYKEGMGSSVRCGMQKLDPAAKAVLIALADQPYIKPSTINILMAAYRKEGRHIIVPLYNDRWGHPVLFSKKYFPQLRQLSGTKGGSSIIGRNPADVCRIRTGDKAVNLDIDTPQDLQEARNNLYCSQEDIDE